MAIYHCSVKILGRSAGRSATAAAAYRSAERLVDSRTDSVHDYTRKGGVDFTTVLAPDAAPAWMLDRSALWNAVEAAERRKDAQVAREVEVALPRELGLAQMRDLVTSYAASQFVAQGMVADVAIHHARGGNPHAHLLLTTREVSESGFGGKNRAWNDKRQVAQWREAWATHANRALERSGHEARIDHRTLAAQGLDRAPQVHLGPHVVEMERRGEPTDRGGQHREIEVANAALATVTQDLDETEVALRHELARQAAARQAQAVAAARQEALWSAVRGDDLETAQALVAEGVDPHRRDARGRTLLHAAAWHEASLELTRWLVGLGLDVEAREDEQGATALHVAAYRSTRGEVIGMYLAAGADAHGPDQTGWTPVMIAATSTAHEGVMGAFVAWGAVETGGRDADGRTLLHHAGRNPHPGAARALLAGGWDPEALDRWGRTPARVAQRLGASHEATGGVLVAAAARQAQARQAALVSAVGRDAVGELPALVSAGADPQWRGAEEQTLLHEAAWHQASPAMITALVSLGVDVGARDVHERTALHVAASRSEGAASIQAYLEAGADPQARNRAGHTPAQVAAQRTGHEAVMRAFLGVEAVDRRDGVGWTLLHHAARNPSPSAARGLLAQGWDPEARDAWARTPAEIAQDPRVGNLATSQVLASAVASRQAEREAAWLLQAQARQAEEANKAAAQRRAYAVQLRRDLTGLQQRASEVRAMQVSPLRQAATQLRQARSRLEPRLTRLVAGLGSELEGLRSRKAQVQGALRSRLQGSATQCREGWQRLKGRLVSGLRQGWPRMIDGQAEVLVSTKAVDRQKAELREEQDRRYATQEAARATLQRVAAILEPQYASSVIAWDRAMAAAIETRLETLGAAAEGLGQRHHELGAATMARREAQPPGVEIRGHLYIVEGQAEGEAYTAALAREDEAWTAWAETRRELGECYEGVVAWAEAQVEAAYPGLTARVESARAWLAGHPPSEGSKVSRELDQACWSHLVMAQAAEQACDRQAALDSTMRGLHEARVTQAQWGQGKTWRPAQLFQGAVARQAEVSRLEGEISGLEQQAAEGVQAQQWSATSRALAEAAVAESEPQLAESVRRYEAQRQARQEAERQEQVHLICEQFEAARQAQSWPELDARLKQDLALLRAHCDTHPDDFPRAMTLAHTFVQVGYLESGLATFHRVKDEGPPGPASDAQHYYDQIVQAESTIQEAHQDLTRQFQEQIRAEAHALAKTNLEAQQAIQAEKKAHQANQPPHRAPDAVLDEWDRKNADLKATHRELYDEGERIQDLTDFNNPTSLGSQALHQRLERQAPHLHQAHRRIEREEFDRQLDRQIRQKEREASRSHGHEL